MLDTTPIATAITRLIAAGTTEPAVLAAVARRFPELSWRELSTALQVAQAARASGCKVLALTDSAASPLSLLADETLLFAIRSPSFFPSIAAALALTEALLELLASRAGKPVVKRIHEAEAQLFESGAYLQPPPLRGG